MSNPPTTPQANAAGVVDRAQAAGKAVYDAVNATLQDPLKASNAASDAISHAISHSTAIKGVIDAFLVLLNPLLTAFFAALSEVRHGVTDTMGATTAEVLNEFLGTEFDSSVVTPGASPDETLAKAQKIGQAILQRLEVEFTQTATGGTKTGEQAAQTFAGYGANFAIQTAIIAIIGAFVPETHLDEVRELGVQVAQNLGLGRLIRQALRPLVQATIATPYTRELNERYRPNLLPVGELVKALHAERIDAAKVTTWLYQQGHADANIAELLEQTRQRLSAQEWNSLVALGKQSPDATAYDDQAAGMDDDWIALRQAVLTWQRLAAPRNRLLSELVSQVNNRWIPITSLDSALDRYGVPQDEQDLWRAAASVSLEAGRKRPSQADMLFLYEASQITDQDVEDWLIAEGYYADDLQNMLTFFRLKFLASTQGVSAAKAARLAALHSEHVAYVTDEITGLWSRPPTTAEVNYWTNLLDSGARTKHDFVTELKALPTTGPAMP